jgi:hypothetical protein
MPVSDSFHKTIFRLLDDPQLEKQLKKPVEIPEKYRFMADENVPPPDDDFVNPSKELFQNPFLKQFEPTTAKEKFISRFVSREIANIIFDLVDERIDRSMAEHKKMDESLNDLVNRFNKFREHIENDTDEKSKAIDGDAFASSEESADDDHSAPSEEEEEEEEEEEDAPIRLQFLQKNTAVKTLRKMFQTVHTFRIIQGRPMRK